MGKNEDGVKKSKKKDPVAEAVKKIENAIAGKGAVKLRTPPLQLLGKAFLALVKGKT